MTYEFCPALSGAKELLLMDAVLHYFESLKS